MRPPNVAALNRQCLVSFAAVAAPPQFTSLQRSLAASKTATGSRPCRARAGSFYYASMARWNPSSRRNGARARSNWHADVFRRDLQARRDDPISGSRTRSTYRACATDGRQRHLSVGFPNERRNIASLNYAAHHAITGLAIFLIGDISIRTRRALTYGHLS